ncbi:TPA: hypothetical protein ACVO0U_004485 [Vibrio alginolyticus]
MITKSKFLQNLSSNKIKEDHAKPALLKIVDRKDGVNGWAVSIPVESTLIRESFKETFKTRKWDGDNKLWCVGSRSKTRLQQWVDMINNGGISEAEAELIEAELTTKELEKLRNQLAAEKERAETKLGIIAEKNAQLKAEIDELKKSSLFVAELNEAVTKAEAETSELKAQKKSLEDNNIEILNKLVSTATIKSALNEMCKYGRLSGDYNRNKYREAQETFIELHERLTEIGLISESIRQLSMDNFNRGGTGDRDYAGRYELSDLAKLEKIEL